MKFKQTNTIKSRTWVAAVAGILSITVSAVTQAAFVPVTLIPPTVFFPAPPAAILSPTAGAVGTAILPSVTATPGSVTGVTLSGATLTTSFTLRSMAVDRGAGLLDFYYQVVNTSTGVAPLSGADIWRIVNSNYTPATTGGLSDATFLSTNLAGLTNVASLPASWNTAGTAASPTVYSADSDPGAIVNGPLGFTFDVLASPNGLLGNGPANVDAPGQISPWMVVRTNATQWGLGNAEIDTGTGTINPALFPEVVPIPEPSSVIFGLAVAGICLRGGVKALRRKNA